MLNLYTKLWQLKHQDGVKYVVLIKKPQKSTLMETETFQQKNYFFIRTTRSEHKIRQRD